MSIHEAKARYNAIWEEEERHEQMVREGKEKEESYTGEEFLLIANQMIDEIFDEYGIK